MIRHHLTVWATSLLPARRPRRPYTRALAAFRLALLGSLVVLAASLAAELGTDVYQLAAGVEVWAEPGELAAAWTVGALLLYPVASLLLPRPRREGVRR